MQFTLCAAAELVVVVEIGQGGSTHNIGTIDFIALIPNSDSDSDTAGDSDSNTAGDSDSDYEFDQL
jgi:hypothetical protein